jgi:hypothetical protein
MLSNHPNLLGRGAVTPAGSTGVVGGPSSSTDNALVRFDGTTGKVIQSGVVTEADYTGTLTGATDQATTSAAGSAFTNQPANDGIEVLSASAADTTQTVTIIGTTNGTDTVVVETVTLTGTTPVSTVKTDWGVVLAVKKSAATTGTVTVREASADLTITAGLTSAVLSVGVNTVTNTAAFNRAVSMVGSGATTKQIGVGGTNTAGTTIYDSKALNGTTAVTGNSSFLTVTEIYTGDLEATRTVALTTNGGWVLTGGGGGTLTFNTLSTGIAINGALAFASGSTSAFGWSMGSDIFGYRFGTAGFRLESTGGSARQIDFDQLNTTSPRINSQGNLVLGSANAASIVLTTNAGTTAASFDSSQNTTLVGGIISYKGVTTAGWGVPAIQANGAIAATTNARSAAVATYTVGAADGTFVVSGNVNVTTSTTHSFSLDCSYTDENNVARVLVMPMAQLAGSFVATGLITNVTGAGPYESASMTIRCKAATSITIRPSAGGTYTTCTYDTYANIQQVG